MQNQQVCWFNSAISPIAVADFADLQNSNFDASVCLSGRLLRL